MEYYKNNRRNVDSRRDSRERVDLKVNMKFSSSFYYDKKETPGENSSVKEGGYLFHMSNVSYWEGHHNYNNMDGCVIVADCIEGTTTMLENLVRTVLSQGLKPILFLNKLDRLFIELQMSDEEIYKVLNRVIDDINICIDYLQDREEKMFDPVKGNVIFGSSLHGWAFTLNTFAQMYSNKFKIETQKLKKYLWGEHYYDHNNKKFTNVKEGNMKNFFCFAVLDPINKLIRLSMEGKGEKAVSVAQKNLGVAFTREEKELQGKYLYKNIFSKWLSHPACLFDTIIEHLPSPLESQKLRSSSLYSGPMDDPFAKGMVECNPKAPLIAFVNDKFTKYVVARVFSGTIFNNQIVSIFGSNYEEKLEQDLHKYKKIKIFFACNDFLVPLKKAESGSYIIIEGINEFITKGATIVEKAENCYPLLTERERVLEPKYRVGLICNNPKDMPKLMEALKFLHKSMTFCEAIVEDTGELFLEGPSRVQVEITLQDVLERSNGLNVTVTPPVIPYRETISVKGEFSSLQHFKEIDTVTMSGKIILFFIFLKYLILFETFLK